MAGPGAGPRAAFEETTMTQKNPMQISARMDEIDAVLETEGVDKFIVSWDSELVTAVTEALGAAKE